ncbi:MAG: hypothetical protein IT178_03675, partial [Acidobacteria bacterium]|nr:hypothetical protein [Acidobacteriota bacterium]
MTAWTLALAVALQVPATPPPPPPAPSAQHAPASEEPPATQPPAASPTTAVDPAAASFATNVGLLLVLVKADKTADYEGALTALQGALAASTDPARRTIAQGWRVFKAAEADAKGNAVYVHALLPAVPGVDYRPSLFIDELIADAPADLL